MKVVPSLAMLLLFPASAAGAEPAVGAMTLETFLGRADALKAKGPFALLSGDLGRLKREIVGANNVLRAERMAAQKAGKRAAYCPPNPPSSLKTEELLDHFRSIPLRLRLTMPVKDGLLSLLARKHPCLS